MVKQVRIGTERRQDLVQFVLVATHSFSGAFSGHFFTKKAHFGGKRVDLNDLARLPCAPSNGSFNLDAPVDQALDESFLAGRVARNP